MQMFKGLWSSPLMEGLKDWFGRQKDRFMGWWKKSTVQQRRRVVSWTGVGLFCLAILMKTTAVLMTAAVVGFGGFLAFWVLYSFAAAKWPAIDEWRMNHQGIIETIAIFGCPILIGLTGGTLAHLLGGWLMGEMVSAWNLTSSRPAEVIVEPAQGEPKLKYVN